jgi:hypothetical protein
VTGAGAAGATKSGGKASGASPPKGVSMNLDDLSPELQAQVRAQEEAESAQEGAESPPDAQEGAESPPDKATHDHKVTVAYEAGRSGKAPDPDYDDDEAAAHSSGVEEAAQPAAAPPIAAPVAGGPGGPIKGEGAPAILGIVAYCLVINWFRYGWPGVTGWFSAKFINKPTIAATRTAAK